MGVGLLLVAAAVAGYTTAASSGEYVEVAHRDAGGGGGGSTTYPTLEVNLTDNLSFDPAYLSVQAGATENFDLVNVGQYNHSFTLSSQANDSINRTDTPEQLYRYFVANATVNVTVAPGTTRNFTLDIPEDWAGDSFEFVSIVPYQFQAGMYGYLNVTSAGGGASFTVTDQTEASALAFTPAAIEVAATSFPVHIEVEVSNLGSTGHTWTLVAQADTNMTSSGFTAYFQAHPPAANLAVPTGAGIIVTANITLDAKGTYQYLCTVPGHFANGMYGFLYVGVPAPAVAAPPSTAIVEIWVLAGAASVLGIGALLAVSSAFVGRFPPPSEKGPGESHY